MQAMARSSTAWKYSRLPVLAGGGSSEEEPFGPECSAAYGRHEHEIDATRLCRGNWMFAVTGSVAGI